MFAATYNPPYTIMSLHVWKNITFNVFLLQNQTCSQLASLLYYCVRLVFKFCPKSSQESSTSTMFISRRHKVLYPNQVQKISIPRTNFMATSEKYSVFPGKVDQNSLKLDY